MINFGYYLGTLVTGTLVHLLCYRYLTVYGVGPNILLLVVVAHGFLFGPLVGELFGFSLGLILDSMGASLFGMHALLLTLIGYATGRLRRRVASDRPTGQIVIAVTVTVLYAFGASFVSTTFEGASRRVSMLSVFFECAFNAMIMPVVFNAVEQWGFLWKENPERI